MSLEDEARKAYLARKRSNALPQLSEQELLAEEAREAYKKKLAKETLLQKTNRKLEEWEKNREEIKKQTKKNIREFAEQVGDKGLDAALGVGSLLESPVHLADWGIRKATGSKRPGIPWGSDLARDAIKQLQGRDIRAAPTSYGGDIGAGVGTAIGSLLPGVGGALAAETAIAPAIAKASPKAGAAVGKFAEKMGREMLTKEAAALTGISGLASGQLRSIGVDPVAADVAGALFPAGASAVMKAGPAIAKSASAAKKQFLPSAAQAEERAGEKLSKILGKDIHNQAAIKKLEEFDPTNFPEGYNPLTAEIMESPEFAAINRQRRDIGYEGGREINERTLANNAVLNEALEGLGTDVAPQKTKNFVQNYAQNRKQQLQDLVENAEEGIAQEARGQFGQSATPEEAGNAIQEAIDAERIRLDQLRQPAREKYQAIEQATDHHIAPTETIATIEKEMASAKGKVQTSLKKARSYLNSNQGNSIAGADGELIPMPNALEVHNARSQITDDMRAAYKAGRTAEGNSLRKVRTALDEEIADKYPALTDARKQFHAASPEYNALIEHPALGADAVRDEFGQGFKTQASKVADKYIKGTASVENAEALWPIIEDNLPARQTVQNYINNSILYELLDKKGNVTVGSLDAWRKGNPGAFILDPNLETKLKSVTNARGTVNNIISANKLHLEELQTEAAKGILGSDPNKMVKGVFGQKNSAERIKDGLELVRRDPTGLAEQGYKQAISDEIGNVVKTLGAGNTNIGIEKYHKLFANNKDALAQIYTADQMKVLQQLDNVVMGRNQAETLGKFAGSETAGKTALGMAMRHIWAKMPGKGVLGAAGEFAYFKANQRMQEAINQALVDPKFAAELLKKAKPMTEAQAKNYLEKALKLSYQTVNRANAAKLQEARAIEEED